MQGGARKAAMAGFFFFTKKRLDGAASAPRRPPRSSGRPDDFADHSCGYPRPSRAAGRFYARQRPLRRHPRPFPRAAGRKIERRRHGSRGRAPAAHRAPPARQTGFMAAATVAPPSSPPARVRAAAQAGMSRGAPHWCGQRFPLRWRRAVSGKGAGKEGRRRGRRAQRPGARYGRADDGGAGRGKRKKRKGEWARVEGEGRRGEWARAEGRACRG